MQKSWYRSNLAIILLHIAAWLLFILVPFWFQSNLRPPSMTGVHRNLPPIGPSGTNPLLRINIMLIAVFYLNAYIFLPLLNKRRVILFIAAHIVTLFCIVIIDYGFVSTRMGNGFPIGAIIFRLTLSYIFMVAVSTSYRLILERIESRQVVKERENEALKSELALLRSQVSPHFMFNVLNSMVALARKKEDLEPSLIQLSALMRYMTYSFREDKVLLHKEIEYLNSYIDLQRLRFGQSVNIEIHLQNEAGTECMIEPMILIPFIENAFKHGTNYPGDPEIQIHLTVSPSNRLYLFVHNRYIDADNGEKGHLSGIGLENVRKRLELLYKDKYVLKTEGVDNRFTVEISLNLC